MAQKSTKNSSYFINKYNSLDGKIVKRKTLLNFLEELKHNLGLYETHLDVIADKIMNLLDKNQDDNEFEIKLKQKYSVASLNGANQETTIKEIQGLGIPYLPKIVKQKETKGLNKPVSSNDIYNMITNKIIELIKKSDKLKFKKTWTDVYTSDYLIAYNFITKKPYRSINQFLLSFYGLENPYFLTFKQIEKLGGKIKKGAKAHPITYYTILYTFKQKGQKSFGSYDVEKFIKHLSKFVSEKVTKDNLHKIKGVDVIPIIRYYNVFNGADITGIDFDLKNFDLPGKIPENKKTKNKTFVDNLDAENIIKLYPKPAPKLVHKKQNKAYHQSSGNNGNSLIVMPTKQQFDSENDYYKTLFHEYSHSTGTPNRLNRKLGNIFGTKAYAFEELIAELSAVFLANEVGIRGKHIKNNVAYIKGWNKILIEELENDNKFIFQASAKAQKSADYILQRDENDVPLFRRIEKPKSKPKVKETTEKQKVKRVFKEISKTSRSDETIYNFNLDFGDDFFLNILSVHRKRTGLSKGDILNSIWIDKYKFAKDYKLKKNHNFFYKLSDVKDAIEKLINDGTILKYKKDNVKSTTLETIYGVKQITNKPKITKKEIVGYALVDNISGEIVVMRKTLQELEKTYHNTENNVGFKGMKILVYEIIKAKPKNKLGKKIDVDFSIKKNIQEKQKSLSKPTKQKPKTKQTIKGLVPVSQQKKRNYPTYKDLEHLPLYQFYGNLEIKSSGSIVCTTDAPQGAGKTRLHFQKANMFDENGYKVLFMSLEEHPDSRLFNDKVEQYLSKKAKENFYPIGEIDKKTLEELLPQFDIIFVDSWNKLVKELKDKDNYNLDIDYDIRKKYNGKFFDMIFQRTSDGKMRGGSKSQFDGDIITKIQKCDNWKDNYSFYDKNRYMIDNYVWNIHEQKLYLHDEYIKRFETK